MSTTQIPLNAQAHADARAQASRAATTAHSGLDQPSEGDAIESVIT